MDAKDRKIEQPQRMIAEQAATIKKLVQRVDQLERKLAAARPRCVAAVRAVQRETMDYREAWIGVVGARRQRTHRGTH